MPERFDFFNSLGYIIQRVAHLYRNKLHRTFKQNNFNLTPEQWAILNILYKKDNISQTEIADITQKDKTLITRMLDFLEKNGTIKRKKDTNDRRSYKIILTEKGKAIIPSLNRFAKEDLDLSLRGIKKEQLEIFNYILKCIEKNII